jgi:hypothetical protein
MVVAVLMISCQASEKWKMGPVSSQTRITSSAAANAHALPSKIDEWRAKTRNASLMTQN